MGGERNKCEDEFLAIAMKRNGKPKNVSFQEPLGFLYSQVPDRGFVEVSRMNSARGAEKGETRAGLGGEMGHDAILIRRYS